MPNLELKGPIASVFRCFLNATPGHSAGSQASWRKVPNGFPRTRETRPPTGCLHYGADRRGGARSEHERRAKERRAEKRSGDNRSAVEAPFFKRFVSPGEHSGCPATRAKLRAPLLLANSLSFSLSLSLFLVGQIVLSEAVARRFSPC